MPSEVTLENFMKKLLRKDKLCYIVLGYSFSNFFEIDIYILKQKKKQLLHLFTCCNN